MSKLQALAAKLLNEPLKATDLANVKGTQGWELEQARNQRKLLAAEQPKPKAKKAKGTKAKSIVKEIGKEKAIAADLAKVATLIPEAPPVVGVIEARKAKKAKAAKPVQIGEPAEAAASKPKAKAEPLAEKPQAKVERLLRSKARPIGVIGGEAVTVKRDAEAALGIAGVEIPAEKREEAIDKAARKGTRGNTSPAPKPANAENAKAIEKAPKPLPKGTVIDGIDCSGMFDDPRKEGVPVYLQAQNRKALSPAEKAKVDELMKAQRQDAADRSEQYRAAQKEAKKEQARTKAQARKEKRAAEAAGKTTAMPLSGKEAVAAIKGKGKAAKAEKTAPKGTAKAPAKAPKAKEAATAGRARYDWNAAREAAAKGKVPAAPDFSADTHRYYRPLLEECEKLVKARDLAGLQKFRINGSNTSPAAIKRYREIAIIALKAKA